MAMMLLLVEEAKRPEGGEPSSIYEPCDGG